MLRLNPMPSLLIAALFVGCASPSTPVSESPSPKVPELTQDQDTSSDSPQKPDERRNVPERLHQLKDLEQAEVKWKDHVFKLWVMDTESKRMEGMMFLKDSDFKDDEGMIFVFDREEPRRFWMRNTLVELDIAYCRGDGTVLNGYTMKRLDETTDYSSRGAAKFVIELRAGTMKKLGITAGTRFLIPPGLKSQN